MLTTSQVKSCTTVLPLMEKKKKKNGGAGVNHLPKFMQLFRSESGIWSGSDIQKQFFILFMLFAW